MNETMDAREIVRREIARVMWEQCAPLNVKGFDGLSEGSRRKWLRKADVVITGIMVQPERIMLEVFGLGGER